MTIAVLSLPRRMMICVYYSISAEGHKEMDIPDMDPLPAAAPEPLNHGLDIYIIYKYRTHRIEDLL